MESIQKSPPVALSTSVVKAQAVPSESTSGNNYKIELLQLLKNTVSNEFSTYDAMLEREEQIDGELLMVTDGSTDPSGFILSGLVIYLFKNNTYKVVHTEQGRVFSGGGAPDPSMGVDGDMYQRFYSNISTLPLFGHDPQYSYYKASSLRKHKGMYFVFFMYYDYTLTRTVNRQAPTGRGGMTRTAVVYSKDDMATWSILYDFTEEFPNWYPDYSRYVDVFRSYWSSYWAADQIHPEEELFVYSSTTPTNRSESIVPHHDDPNKILISILATGMYVEYYDENGNNQPYYDWFTEARNQGLLSSNIPVAITYNLLTDKIEACEVMGDASNSYLTDRTSLDRNITKWYPNYLYSSIHVSATQYFDTWAKYVGSPAIRTRNTPSTVPGSSGAHTTQKLFEHHGQYFKKNGILADPALAGMLIGAPFGWNSSSYPTYRRGAVSWEGIVGVNSENIHALVPQQNICYTGEEFFTDLNNYLTFKEVQVSQGHSAQLTAPTGNVLSLNISDTYNEYLRSLIVATLDDSGDIEYYSGIVSSFIDPFKLRTTAAITDRSVMGMWRSLVKATKEDSEYDAILVNRAKLIKSVSSRNYSEDILTFNFFSLDKFSTPQTVVDIPIAGHANNYKSVTLNLLDIPELNEFKVANEDNLLKLNDIQISELNGAVYVTGTVDRVTSPYDSKFFTIYSYDQFSTYKTVLTEVGEGQGGFSFPVQMGDTDTYVANTTKETVSIRKIENGVEAEIKGTALYGKWDSEWVQHFDTVTDDEGGSGPIAIKQTFAEVLATGNRAGDIPAIMNSQQIKEVANPTEPLDALNRLTGDVRYVRYKDMLLDKFAFSGGNKLADHYPLEANSEPLDPRDSYAEYPDYLPSHTNYGAPRVQNIVYSEELGKLIVVQRTDTSGGSYSGVSVVDPLTNKVEYTIQNFDNRAAFPMAQSTKFYGFPYGTVWGKYLQWCEYINGQFFLGCQSTNAVYRVAIYSDNDNDALVTKVAAGYTATSSIVKATDDYLLTVDGQATLSASFLELWNNGTIKRGDSETTWKMGGTRGDAYCMGLDLNDLRAPAGIEVNREEDRIWFFFQKGAFMFELSTGQPLLFILFEKGENKITETNGVRTIHSEFVVTSGADGGLNSLYADYSEGVVYMSGMINDIVLRFFISPDNSTPWKATWVRDDNGDYTPIPRDAEGVDIFVPGAQVSKCSAVDGFIYLGTSKGIWYYNPIAAVADRVVPGNSRVGEPKNFLPAATHNFHVVSLYEYKGWVFAGMYSSGMYKLSLGNKVIDLEDKTKIINLPDPKDPLDAVNLRTVEKLIEESTPEPGDELEPPVLDWYQPFTFTRGESIRDKNAGGASLALSSNLSGAKNHSTILAKITNFSKTYPAFTFDDGFVLVTSDAISSDYQDAFLRMTYNKAIDKAMVEVFPDYSSKKLYQLGSHSISKSYNFIKLTVSASGPINTYKAPIKVYKNGSYVTTISSWSGSSFVYQDNTVAASTTYTYKFVASLQGWTDSDPYEVTVTSSAQPSFGSPIFTIHQNNPSKIYATINATGVAGTATYKMYVRQKGSSTWILAANRTGISPSNFSQDLINNPSPNVTFEFKLETYPYDSQYAPVPDIIKEKTALNNVASPPTGFYGYANSYDIRLSWTRPSSYTNFTIQKRTATGSWGTVTTTSGSSFNDAGIVNKPGETETYYYRIRTNRTNYTSSEWVETTVVYTVPGGGGGILPQI